MNEIQQYLVEEELWRYSEGWISRRDFLRRAAVLGAGAATAAAMAASISPVRPAKAAPASQGVSPFSVPEGDPNVATDWVWYRSTGGAEVKAYVTWPAGTLLAASLPGVTVCHENQGVNDHIKDVARRFGKAGYVAIAPDLVSRFGTATDEFATPEDLMAAYRLLTPEQNALDFAAALDFLRTHPAVDGNKLAATGYCFGGGVIWRLATIYPALTAAAPFYGANPPLDQVPNIRAAMLAVYGELDNNVNSGIPAITAAMDAAGVRYQVNIYPNSMHAFHADHRPSFNPVTAPQAYIDTLNWFSTYLGLQPPAM